MERFKFTCNECEEQFSVEFKYMLKKEALVCPNCSNTLSDDALQHLKTIVSSIEEYEKIGADKCAEHSKHFFMTLS